MITDLRPLSIGEILDRTINLYRSRFALFFGIVIPPTALYYALYALIFTLYSQTYRSAGHHGLLKLLAYTSNYLPYLLHPILLSLALAAINKTVLNLYSDQPVGLSRAYRQIQPHWRRYIAIRFLVVMVGFGPMLLYMAIVFRGESLQTSVSSMFDGNSPFVFFFPLLLFYGCGYLVSIRLAFAVPASVCENLGVASSIKRSLVLTRKCTGRILLLAMMFVALSYGLMYPTSFAFHAGSLRTWQGHKATGLLFTTLGWVGSFLIGSVLYPLYSIAAALLYIDQRIRKEGFDIELMMQRANLADTETLPEPATPPLFPSQTNPPDPVLG